MYAKYLKEREGKEILEHPHGFTVYGYDCVPGVPFPHLYIADNWVDPDHRKSGIAKTMADEIARMARHKGYTVMLGSVDGNAKGAHESLLVLIAYGMKLYTVQGTTVWFKKDI